MGRRQGMGLSGVQLMGVAVLLFLISGSGVTAIGCKGKSSWPELVGAYGLRAAAIIQRQNPYVKAVLVKEGSLVTQDFRCNRVRVWINSKAKVSRVPVIG